MDWVYMLECGDGSLYTGWTNDLARRVKAHRSGKGGARYTKSHGRDAVRLAYAEKCTDKSTALKREAALKKLSKADKEALAARWAADNKITLRMATPDDAAAVCALYNWYVRHGTQTFQYAPSTVEEYRANIAHVRENAPFILAESADGRLQGFACAHLWHEREAYSWDVETTVYCAPDCVGQGVGGRLHRCDLYVTLEPCPMCAGALINSRMKTVYYGAPDPKAGSCGSLINLFALPYNHQPALVSGVLEQECADILRNFFRELRKKRKEIRKLEKSRVEEQS